MVRTLTIEIEFNPDADDGDQVTTLERITLHVGDALIYDRKVRRWEFTKGVRL